MRPTPLVATFASLFLASSLLIGCAGGLGGGFVAKVNNDVISKGEFDKEYGQMLKMMHLEADAMKDPKYAPMVQMFQKVTLQSLILDHLITQEAKKRNLSVSDTDLKPVLENQMTQAGGEKALTEQLNKLGLNMDHLKQELKDQILKDKVVTAIAGDRLNVSEAEAKSFYESHPKEFDVPEQVRARHLLVTANAGQLKQDYSALKSKLSEAEQDAKVQAKMAEKRQIAEKLLAEAKLNPAGFAALATKNSDDKASAVNGGDLGFFSREMMVPEFSKAAFEGKPGVIYDKLVQSAYGYHIIEVIDRKAPEKRQFADAKAQIMAVLQNQRKSQTMESWVASARKQAHIEIAPEYNFEKVDEANAAKALDQAPKKAK